MEKRRDEEPLHQLCLTCKLAAASNIPISPLPNHKVSINRTSYCTFTQPVLWVHTIFTAISHKGLSPRQRAYNILQVVPIALSVTTNQMPASINQMDIYMAELKS